jgi:crotonobetainyl-CoA:carnitine CoA-transferase CaiB-like acyl-CoA transferase
MIKHIFNTRRRAVLRPQKLDAWCFYRYLRCVDGSVVIAVFHDRQQPRHCHGIIHHVDG